MLIGAAFCVAWSPTFPYKLHTVLTDNGVPFTNRPDKRSGPTRNIGFTSSIVSVARTTSPTSSLSL